MTDMTCQNKDFANRLGRGRTHGGAFKYVDEEDECPFVMSPHDTSLQGLTPEEMSADFLKQVLPPNSKVRRFIRVPKRLRKKQVLLGFSREPTYKPAGWSDADREPGYIDYRYENGALKFTDFIYDHHEERGIERIQLAVTPFQIKDDAFGLIHALMDAFLSVRFLRVRITVRRVRQNEQSCSARMKLDVELLNKLKSTTLSLQPKKLTVKTAPPPVDSSSPLPSLLRQDGEEYVNDLPQFLQQLSNEQLEADKSVIATFTDEVPTTPLEAERLFNRHLRRAVQRASWPEFNQQEELSGVSKLPSELIERIVFFAVFNHQLDGTRLFPFCSTVDPGRVESGQLKMAPLANDGMLVCKSYGDLVRERLTSDGVWHFDSPRALDEWFTNPDQKYRPQIRQIELQFDGDIYLEFLKSELTWGYSRDDERTQSLGAGYSVDKFLDAVKDRMHPSMRIFLRMPDRDRKREVPEDFRNGCHKKLCMWIVKAFSSAAARHTDISRRVTYLSDLDDVLTPAWQIERDRDNANLADFAGRCEEVSWRQLIADTHDDLYNENKSDEHNGVVWNRNTPPRCYCRPLSMEVDRIKKDWPKGVDPKTYEVLDPWSTSSASS